jgi:hypothetical protein
MRRRAMTAAAQSINLRDRTEARRLRVLRQGWQEDAWAYAESLPELSFAYRFLANCSKRMRVFPACVNPDDPDGAPISLSEAGCPAQVIESSEQAMAALGVGRIAKSPLMEALSWSLGVPGEGWLVGGTNPLTGIDEWKVRSIDEVMVLDDVYKLREIPLDPQGTLGWITLDPNTTYVARMWIPNPRFSVLATSPMRALLDTCEELLLLNRDVRAIARSRIAGSGILKVPNGLSISSANDDNGDPMSDDFLGDLATMMMTPIGEEGVASSVVPGVVRGEPDQLNALQHLVLDRPYSPLAMELRNEQIGRLANGLDLPRSVVLGMEEANHWSAWAIDDDTFRHHVEPKVITEVDCLTQAFYRPWLETDEIPEAWVERMVMWYDPVELVTPPDTTATAIQIYNLKELSGESLRKTAGFDETDAPSDIERVTRAVSNTRTFPPNALLAILARLDPTLTFPPITAAGTIPGIKAGLVEQIPVPTVPVPGAPAAPATVVDETPPPVLPAPAAHQPPPDTGPPALPAPPPDTTPNASTSVQDSVGFAARDATGATAVRLSRRLSQIDQEYRAKVQVAANAAMTRVLDKAGAKVRTKVNNSRAKDNAALKAAIDSIPNSQVPSVIGGTVVAAMGFASSTELLNADWSDLKTQFYSWTQAAQRQAMRVAAQLAGIADSDESLDAANTRMAAGVDKAWEFLSNALDAIAERLLYNPAPSAQDVSTFDPNTVVPMGDIRVAASVAGGYDLPKETMGAAPSATAAYPDAPGIPLGTPLGSIGNGATINELLTANSMEVESFEWVHNYAGDHPFEPHEDLDGTTFTSFTDDALLNGGDFPDNQYYMPGDHPGCVCDFTTIWQPSDSSGTDATDG